MQAINVYKSVNDKTYLADSSLHEGDLVIARNGLFIFTALKKNYEAAQFSKNFRFILIAGLWTNS
jgi:hypothetical protein